MATRSNGAPVIGRDGSVVATCAGCVEQRPQDSGVAAFDPKTGARRWFVGVTGIEPRFGTPAVGEDGAAYVLLAFGLGPMQLVAATADGRASSTRFPALGGGDGPVPSVIGAAGGLALPVGQRIWFVDRKTGAGRSVELGASALNAVAAAGMLWVVVQGRQQGQERRTPRSGGLGRSRRAPVGHAAAGGRDGFSDRIRDGLRRGRRRQVDRGPHGAL